MNTAAEVIETPLSMTGAPIFVPEAGIAIDIRSQSDQVVAGSDVIYSITATTGLNDVQDSAGVTAFVHLPITHATLGPQYVDDTAPLGCSLSLSVLTCPLGLIGRGGASRSFLVRMSTPANLLSLGTSSLVASAQVVRSEHDVNAGDNTDYASTLVTAGAQVDLSLFTPFVASAEEQQANQSGLMFNSAVPLQAMPTIPNYGGSSRVTAGRRIDYSVVASNSGPTTANEVIVTIHLPAQVTFYQLSLAVTPTNGAVCVVGTPGDPADPFVCGLGSMQPFAQSLVSFELIVDDSVPAGTLLGIEATVNSAGVDTDTSDNRATLQIPVLAAADLNVSSRATGQNLVWSNDHFVFQNLPDQVSAGHVLRTTITVQNNGPSDSQHVTLRHELPDVAVNGVMPLSFLRSENAECGPEAVLDRDVFCSLGTMAAGERRTFDIYALASDETPDGANLQSCTTGLSSGSNTSPPGAPANPPTGGPTGTLTWDPQTADNQSCTSVVVSNGSGGPAQGLSIDKSGPTTADLGQLVSYTLTVVNAGPGSASNVVVTDYLPAELRSVAVAPSQGSCNVGVPGDTSRPLACNLGTLPAGAVRTIEVSATIKTTALGGTTIHNDVQVTTSTSDPDNSDNIDTVSTWLNPTDLRPDARIRKGSGAVVGNDIYNLSAVGQSRTGKAARGRTITFRISIQNDSASVPDSFMVSAAGVPTTQYGVKYYRGTTDVTAAVVAGTFTTPLIPAGGIVVLKAKVKVNASATMGSGVTRLITIASVIEASSQDAVKFTAKRK